VEDLRELVIGDIGPWNTEANGPIATDDGHNDRRRELPVSKTASLQGLTPSPDHRAATLEGYRYTPPEHSEHQTP
jgi:hypothetical protein